MTTLAVGTATEAARVLAVLEAAGPRGASHEDFVEAGLARDYVSALVRLATEDGLTIKADFTTGLTRWSLRG
jgi:hypothetical protein